VGEWRGDTARREELLALADRYALSKRVPLPNWGDTSAELTVWTARRAGATPGADITRRRPVRFDVEERPREFASSENGPNRSRRGRGRAF